MKQGGTGKTLFTYFQGFSARHRESESGVGDREDWPPDARPEKTNADPGEEVHAAVPCHVGTGGGSEGKQSETYATCESVGPRENAGGKCAEFLGFRGFFSGFYKIPRKNDEKVL